MKRLGCLFILIVLGLSLGFFKLITDYEAQDQNVRIVNIAPVSHAWHKHIRRMVLIKISQSAFEFKLDTLPRNPIYINSSFFDSTGKPIGRVVLDYQALHSNKVKSGGFFCIYQGKPEIQTSIPLKQPQYLCQTRFVGIRNGKIQENICNTPKNKALNYRSVLGFNQKGDFYILHSGRWGFVSMRELLETAKAEGFVNALVFDSGSSLEVGCKTEQIDHEFKAYPNWIKEYFNIRKPSVYITAHKR